MKKSMMLLRRRMSILAVAGMVAAGMSLASVAHAGPWCDKALQFEGHCDVCNAMCILEHWVSGE
jgi:hypothetical protein